MESSIYRAQRKIWKTKKILEYKEGKEDHKEN